MIYRWNLEWVEFDGSRAIKYFPTRESAESWERLLWARNADPVFGDYLKETHVMPVDESDRWFLDSPEEA